MNRELIFKFKKKVKKIFKDVLIFFFVNFANFLLYFIVIMHNNRKKFIKIRPFISQNSYPLSFFLILFLISLILAPLYILLIDFHIFRHYLTCIINLCYLRWINASKALKGTVACTVYIHSYNIRSI